MASDRELLTAWRDGSTRAGADLTARHYDSLYAFFRNKVGDDIDDLLQKTMLACMQAGPRFEGRSSFRTFMFAVARNVLMAHLRKRRRDAAIDVDEVSVEDLGTTPSGVVARTRQARLLLRGLRLIPVEYQVVLELYYWESMTSGELAEVLGIPHSTARTKLRRGREALARRMEAAAADADAARSTLDNLDRWAAGLREAVLAPAAP